MAIILVPTDQPDIASAIAAAAASGDTIRLESAHSPFQGANNRNIDPGGKDIVFEGDTDDPADTVIDGELNTARGFFFHSGETADTIVRNLTITHMRSGAGRGAGVYVASSTPTFTNFIIDDCNTAIGTDGGGMYLTNATCDISHFIIRNCYGYEGSGITMMATSYATISHGQIYNCGTAHYGGGANVKNGSVAIFTNVLFYGNTASHGGGAYIGTGGSQFHNCTITANHAASNSSGGGVISNQCSTIFTNCIIWNNTTGGAGYGRDILTCWVDSVANYCICRSGPVYISCTLVKNNCIEADPEWIAGPSGGYYLNCEVDLGADSPGIDAGSDTAAALGMDTRTTRTDDTLDQGQVDIGYHYSPSYIAPVADFSASPTSAELRCKDNGITVQFTDMSTGDVTSWSWDFGDGETGTQQNPEHTYTSAGTYVVTLVATGPAGDDTTTLTIIITDVDENVTTHYCIPYYKG